MSGLNDATGLFRAFIAGTGLFGKLGAVVTPVNSVLPVITGTAQVGQVLAASNGTWTGPPSSFAFQWKGNGSAIGGATSSSYIPVVGDIGNTITVTVTASNTAGNASATSAATSAVIAAAASGGTLDFSTALNSALLAALGLA